MEASTLRGSNGLPLPVITTRAPPGRRHRPTAAAPAACRPAPHGDSVVAGPAGPSVEVAGPPPSPQTTTHESPGSSHTAPRPAALKRRPQPLSAFVRSRQPCGSSGSSTSVRSSAHVGYQQGYSRPVGQSACAAAAHCAAVWMAAYLPEHSASPCAMNFRALGAGEPLRLPPRAGPESAKADTLAATARRGALGGSGALGPPAPARAASGSARRARARSMALGGGGWAV
mmetsp:Transcript_69903/g.182115  ORF Transcript_69903/g.182115 Transcript_69903/m.182115 type:complete len:229 (-) Transcript_69903:73-759(-)